LVENTHHGQMLIAIGWDDVQPITVQNTGRTEAGVRDGEKL
jgi:hypothetical protein